MEEVDTNFRYIIQLKTVGNITHYTNLLSKTVLNFTRLKRCRKVSQTDFVTFDTGVWRYRLLIKETKKKHEKTAARFPNAEYSG